MKTNAWFLLYGGTSEDGRGPGHFVKRTECPSEARAHYEECRENPYSVGRVDIVTDDCIECAGMLTDWYAYSIAEKREWISMSNEKPVDTGDTPVRIKLIDGSVLEDCLPQFDGDFYWNSRVRELFIDETSVAAWMPTGPQRPEPPEVQ